MRTKGYFRWTWFRWHASFWRLWWKRVDGPVPLHLPMPSDTQVADWYESGIGPVHALNRAIRQAAAT